MHKLNVIFNKTLNQSSYYFDKMFVSTAEPHNLPLRRKIFARIYFRESFFFHISRRFNFVNWLNGGFFAMIYFLESQFYQCFIYFDFFVVCSSASSESRNSYPNFSIFLIALFGYKRLNSRLNKQEEIKRSRYNKKIYIFLMLSLSVIYYIIYIIIYILLFICFHDNRPHYSPSTYIV